MSVAMWLTVLIGGTALGMGCMGAASRGGWMTGAHADSAYIGMFAFGNASLVICAAL